MVGDFISRCLVMLLGYAYPAYECYKTVEKNKVNIDDLRFWCQYWILMAVLSICEIFGDIFISWLPLYGEMKLAFIVYLWYPKTKGTRHVYESFVRPVIAKHESDIDKLLEDLKLRAWDLASHYWQNCAQLGQGAFFQVLQYLLLQSQKLKTAGSFSNRHGGSAAAAAAATAKKTDKDYGANDGFTPPPPPPISDYVPSSPVRRAIPGYLGSPRHGGGNTPPSSPSRLAKKSQESFGQSMLSRSVAPLPQVNTVKLEPEEAYTKYVHVEEVLVEADVTGSQQPAIQLRQVNERVSRRNRGGYVKEEIEEKVVTEEKE